MGPESAKTFPGQTLVETSGLTAGRAKQEIDYGRRGKGYIFGAFRPATGEAFTRPYLSRSTACWVAFLEEVELWLPAESERVYAILDNLSAHRATDVLLFMLAHPRWEMVFYRPVEVPTDAAPFVRRLCECRAHPSGVRKAGLPAQVRRLSQPDRAVVEGAALASAEGPAL